MCNEDDTKQQSTGLEDLVEAFTILSKYDEERERSPTNCEHDILRVYVSGGDSVSTQDTDRLNELGFLWDADDLECWYSTRFGSN